ncbi:MAG: hypothetical protein HFG92_18770 [Dorea sp.]|jgi:hypothetical protein|nr:hypothetical protein [Dorea sp.]
MNKPKGSMEALSAMQITTDMEGLDAQSKSLLQYAEILAVILRDTITEYKGYSWKEVAEFIELDSITSTTEVSPGRTNTRIRSDTTEYTQLNEKTSLFDLAFCARNPQLSTEDIQINLHIDVEPQKTYTPGYPIEKRGMYYLARRLSSQLSLATQGTDYNLLTKCYSIWICRNDIPKEDQYSISVYEMTNTKNTASKSIPKENFDLITLVVIKLGNTVYNGDEEDENYQLLRFLNTIMYPHKDDFMDTVSEYIDYTDNDALRKEVTHVSTIEEIKYEGMRDELREELTEELTKELTVELTKELTEKITEDLTEKITQNLTEKITQNLTEKITQNLTEKITQNLTEKTIHTIILDNLEEHVPKDRILTKLQKHFNLSKEESEHYYNTFTART